MITIKNGELQLEINELGAELFSIKSSESGYEHLWQGDPSYWKSRSPVLFPIVGAIYGNTCNIDGKQYHMNQHGIARHAQFEVIAYSQEEVTLSLKSSAETKAQYPYDFELRLSYKLEGSSIAINYEVINPSDETIFFQLGAHPGFNFASFDADAPLQGYFQFNDKGDSDSLTLSKIAAGFYIPEKDQLALTDKRIAITKETFNNDALIFEDSQTKDISLLDANGKAYIRVKYDAPVVGLWSKACNNYSPFTCIEPWYGRCDSSQYAGEFKDKDWMQSLAAGDSFTTTITIEIIK